MMWLFVMFDLPVLTKSERKEATRFRNDLLNLGFEMAQFSVYLRFCRSQAQVDVLAGKVQLSLPPQGRVSLLTFTDKQYERIISFVGRGRGALKNRPEQLDLF